MWERKELAKTVLQAFVVVALFLIFFQLGEMNVYNTRHEVESYINASCLNGIGNYSIGIDGSVAIWKNPINRSSYIPQGGNISVGNYTG